MKIKLTIKKKNLKGLSDNNHAIFHQQTPNIVGGRMDPPSFGCDTGYLVCGGDSIIQRK
ncbi:hypothetical protein J8L98_02400 [Pseudoalteromonas sp. MMG013]|uniref:Uncharacterized protein n=1 Tax=Pseudoalteromonas aurantia 208 TaxID=1314867 RepID=A0ABR9EJZ3_9GAMM|nr:MULTISPECIES: hypothetical protein [Pseudoalteromonas]MBE0370580.1 hypothetical protein [Pseudoalteromonas aurantia 208]MBQ4845166.1 hypothetical protein [Pseudoalteromonas sp. MMG005]MBQ4851866.1 hypothetical protein [Pseudoalteromonas sp. MMG012]MBQ4860544.1 hypothetical protein [Pseudoalteromonas sp. MMG013]